jgi:hypothetical protein
MDSKRGLESALLSERMKLTRLNKSCVTSEAVSAAAPWTVSPFAALVLNGKSLFDEVMSQSLDPGMPDGTTQLTKPSSSAAASAAKDTEESSWKIECAAAGPDAIRHWQTLKASRVPWPLAQELDRQVALEKWRVLVLDGMNATKLGRQLIDACSHDDPETMCAKIIEDTFQRKATATLNSRASALLIFTRWVKVEFQDCSLWPIREPVLYQYLRYLRDSKAPATRAARMVEAVAFCKGTIGLDHVDELLDSSRVHGAVRGSLISKAPHCKKDHLLVSEVAALEIACCQDDSLPDRIFAGYCCFLAHGRLRCGDGQHASFEPFLDLDDAGEGFVETALYAHKTASLTAKSKRLLPAVAHARGVSGTPWAEAWLDARRQAGLSASKEQPLMPAPLPNAQWSCSKLSTTEAAVWLKEILKRNGCSLEGRNIATHSCKATLLSWAAKASVPGAIRRLLGYHVKPKDKSMLEYSRDAQAAPLEWMRKVVQSIRESRFAPDATRSGRWKAGWSILSQTEPLPDSSGAGASPAPEPAVVEDESGKNLAQETQNAGQSPEVCGKESFNHVETPEARLCSQSPASDDEEFVVLPLDKSKDPGSPFVYQPEGESDDEGFEKVSAASGSDAGSCSDEVATDPPSSDDEPESMRALEALAPAWPQDRSMSKHANEKWFQHHRYKTFHFGNKNSAQALACGRVLSDSYLEVSVPSLAFPKCTTCFGRSE